MNLKDQLQKVHSRKNCDVIVEWVGDDAKRFQQLFSFLFLNDSLLSQRAAWPVSYCVSSYPSLIKRHLKDLLQKMKSTGVHNAIKRNGLRLLNDVEITEKYEGEIIEMCFSFLNSQQEAIAVKTFSMSILERLTLKYPDLTTELYVSIEDQLPHQSTAFKSKGKKILKNLLIKSSLKL